MTEFWLSDEQFAQLTPLLPTDTRGVARVDDRRVISGIERWFSLSAQARGLDKCIAAG